VAEVIELAHQAGAKTLVDGAQWVSHLPVDVRALDADFYAFSGHKVFGPTGIGVLYGKSGILHDMPPWQGGGNMISDVTFSHTSYADPPARFEAGTAAIADAAGLGAALDYVDGLGRAGIAAYEHDLLSYATKALAAVPGLRLLGTAPDKAAVLSFTLAGYPPQEVGTLLNQAGLQHALTQALPSVTNSRKPAPTPKCLNPVALASPGRFGIRRKTLPPARAITLLPVPCLDPGLASAAGASGTPRSHARGPGFPQCNGRRPQCPGSGGPSRAARRDRAPPR
jgi:hypothetical protein